MYAKDEQEYLISTRWDSGVVLPVPISFGVEWFIWKWCRANWMSTIHHSSGHGLMGTWYTWPNCRNETEHKIIAWNKMWHSHTGSEWIYLRALTIYEVYIYINARACSCVWQCVCVWAAGYLALTDKCVCVCVYCLWVIARLADNGISQINTHREDGHPPNAHVATFVY